MNPTSTIDSASLPLTEKNADRLGVAASVLCAIHCALAPVLLIFLPTFGRIWAHPASHALVAILIVPLAAFSILKGFRKHGKRWIPVCATIGILLVLFGAALPAFSKSPNPAPATASEPTPVADSAEAEGCASCEACCESCASEAAAAGTSETPAATPETPADPASCVDGCCPSLQTSESGETSLHIPPAAIITTLGGIFLIAAHLGNLRSGAGTCMMAACPSC